MAQGRTWSLTVIHHDSQTSSAPLTIEAQDWTVALQRGRLVLGDTAPLGQGADCTLAPDGSVIFTDSAAGKTYRLVPVTQAPAPATQAPAPTTHAPAPATQAPAPSASAAAGAHSAATTEGSSEPASSASSASTPPTSSSAASADPVASGTTPTTQEPARTIQLLHARDHNPDFTNPLSYRERSFYIAPSRADDARTILSAQLDELKHELEQAPPGKVIRLAAFDHLWETRPERAPLTVIEWKDWSSHEAPSHSKPPPRTVDAKAPIDVRVSNPPRGQKKSDGGDRLAQVFEALHELFYHTDVAQGAKVVLKILQETVPCEASGVCLYDIDRNELRFVAALGTGASEREGVVFPVDLGILGRSVRALGSPLVTEKPSEDEAFDPRLDLPAGVSAAHMALFPLVRDGYMFGLVQMINRLPPAKGFTDDDLNVAVYTTSQLAKFLQLRRLDTQPTQHYIAMPP